MVENKINYAAPAGSHEFFSGGGNEAIDILNEDGNDEFQYQSSDEEEAKGLEDFKNVFAQN